MKVEEIVGFSLGFMLKKPKSMLFFIPAFLLNIAAAMAIYFILGNLVTNPEEYAELFKPVILSGNFLSIFLIPQIQTTIGFFLLVGVVGWVLTSYASICIYGAAKSEQERKRWKVNEILKKSIGILPGYLLLLITVGIITIIPV